MDELDLELEEMKKIPTQPREVLGLFGGVDFECTMCGETDSIRPPMNRCCWCGQLFKWD